MLDRSAVELERMQMLPQLKLVQASRGGVQRKSIYVQMIG
jgi:hypothetical protein